MVKGSVAVWYQIGTMVSEMSAQQTRGRPSRVSERPVVGSTRAPESPTAFQTVHQRQYAGHCVRTITKCRVKSIPLAASSPTAAGPF